MSKTCEIKFTISEVVSPVHHFNRKNKHFKMNTYGQHNKSKFESYKTNQLDVNAWDPKT